MLDGRARCHKDARMSSSLEYPSTPNVLSKTAASPREQVVPQETQMGACFMYEVVYFHGMFPKETAWNQTSTDIVLQLLDAVWKGTGPASWSSRCNFGQVSEPSFQGHLVVPEFRWSRVHLNSSSKESLCLCSQHVDSRGSLPHGKTNKPVKRLWCSHI